MQHAETSLRGQLLDTSLSQQSLTTSVSQEMKKAFMETGFMDMNYCRGKRYLAGYFRDAAEKEMWVKKKVETWMNCVEVLSKCVRSQPQVVACMLRSSCPFTTNGHMCCELRLTLVISLPQSRQLLREIYPNSPRYHTCYHSE